VQPVVPAEVEEDEGIRPVYWRQQIWVMLRRHLAATSRHSTSSELPGTIPTGAHRLSSAGAVLASYTLAVVGSLHWPHGVREPWPARIGRFTQSPRGG